MIWSDFSSSGLVDMFEASMSITHPGRTMVVRIHIGLLGLYCGIVIDGGGIYK